MLQNTLPFIWMIELRALKKKIDKPKLYQQIIFIILFCIAFIPLLARRIINMVDYTFSVKNNDNEHSIIIEFKTSPEPQFQIGREIKVEFFNNGNVIVKNSRFYEFWEDPKYFDVKNISFEITPTANRISSINHRDSRQEEIAERLKNLNDISIIENDGKVTAIACSSWTFNQNLEIIGALKNAHAETLNVLHG